MSLIKNMVAKSEKKISIAIIGTSNSGKSTLINKIFQSQDVLQATITNSKDLIFYTLDNLSIITWELETKIPQENVLWKRSILGADALLYIMDSTDRSKLHLNRSLIHQLIELNAPIKLLIVAAKSDLSNSMPINELLDALDLVEIDKEKCRCDIFKFSSQTGEGIYAISEWLNKSLFQYKERIINYSEIKAALVLDNNSNIINETIMEENANILLLTAFRELRRKARFFQQTMRVHGTGQEIINIANYKAIFVKDEKSVIGLLTNFNDPIPRTINIAQRVLELLPSYDPSAINLRKLLHDLYPLDLPRKK